MQCFWVDNRYKNSTTIPNIRPSRPINYRCPHFNKNVIGYFNINCWYWPHSRNCIYTLVNQCWLLIMGWYYSLLDTWHIQKVAGGKRLYSHTCFPSWFAIFCSLVTWRTETPDWWQNSEFPECTMQNLLIIDTEWLYRPIETPNKFHYNDPVL